MPKRQAKTQISGSSSSSSSSPSAVSVIIPYAIYLGPVSPASSPTFLSSNSISHVLSIGQTPSTCVSGITYHRLSLTGTPSSSSKLISSTISSANHIITQALQSRNGTRRIYIHCAAGVSRSPTIVIGFLMKERKMSLREAVGVVVRARPQVSPKFLRELREMEVEILGGGDDGGGGGSLDEVLSGEGEELPRRREDRLALFSLGGDG